MVFKNLIEKSNKRSQKLEEISRECDISTSSLNDIFIEISLTMNYFTDEEILKIMEHKFFGKDIDIPRYTEVHDKVVNRIINKELKWEIEFISML